MIVRVTLKLNAKKCIIFEVKTTVNYIHIINIHLGPYLVFQSGGRGRWALDEPREGGPFTIFDPSGRSSFEFCEERNLKIFKMALLTKILY